MKSCALQVSDYLQIADGKEDEMAWAGLRMNDSAQDRKVVLLLARYFKNFI